MLVVGLTGGISSGKSTVADLFAQKNVTIIDADKIAHQITEPKQEAYTNIINLFDENILLPDEKLDRVKLRRIIFADEIKRKKLEQLLHPLIRTEMKRQIAALNANYCIAMIPLLLETNTNPLIQRILVVDTMEELQVSRTMTRDNMRLDNVQKILNAQISREKRLSMADDVIVNNGAIQELVHQVDTLHELYFTMGK